MTRPLIHSSLPDAPRLRPHRARRARRSLQLALGVAVLLAACTSAPPRAPVPAAPPSTVAPPAPAVPGPQAIPSGRAPRPSFAATPRDYRRDAASHLYAHNAERIYRGRLPPLLEAVGVLQVELDGNGQVRRLDWMRAPRHVPQVMADIERLVRAAAPYPAPARLGKVVYTDTWLWHRSGRFQLDTLTEGQD